MKKIFIAWILVMLALAGSACDGKSSEEAGSQAEEKKTQVEKPAVEEKAPAEKAPAEEKVVKTPEEPPPVVEKVHPEPTPPKAPKAPEKPRTITTSVGRLSVGPSAPLGTVEVRFSLTGDWKELRPGSWRSDERGLGFNLHATCNGQCSPATIPGNLERAFAGQKESAERPNVNTGDPELDKVRADVAVLFDEGLEMGRAMALAVDYSDALKEQGPYIPQLRLLCAWHRPGDKWYVQLQAMTPLTAGKAALDDLKAICKSVEVLGPTPAPAEKEAPLVVTGERFALSALPEDAYTVESRNSKKQPSVILLKRPVVFNGLPIAPIDRIYVEYNDDPITLRDIFVADNRPFEVGDSVVICLRRHPLRIDGDGNLRRCVLAEEARFGEVALPQYSEASFEMDRLRRGVLKDDVALPEGTCKGGERIEFDPANEGLTRCVLAKPLTKDDLVLPAGADVQWRGPGLLYKARIPEGAQLKVGEDLHQGPGRARFKQGVFSKWTKLSR